MMGSKWKGNFEGEDRRFVFTNLYGEPYMPEYISSKWKTFTEEKGLKFIKFHGLRHTSASLLINSGVHAKVISDRLGHTNINITMNTYGHVFRKADKDAANKFDDIFNPSPVRPQTKKKRVKSLGTTGI
jgi:integrase